MRNGLGMRLPPEAVSHPLLRMPRCPAAPHTHRNSGFSTPPLTTSFRYIPAAACPGTAQAMRKLPARSAVKENWSLSPERMPASALFVCAPVKAERPGTRGIGLPRDDDARRVRGGVAVSEADVDAPAEWDDDDAGATGASVERHAGGVDAEPRGLARRVVGEEGAGARRLRGDGVLLGGVGHRHRDERACAA